MKSIKKYEPVSALVSSSMSCANALRQLFKENITPGSHCLKTIDFLYNFIESKKKKLEERYSSLDETPANSLMAGVVKNLIKDFPILNKSSLDQVTPYLRLFPKLSIDIIENKEKASHLHLGRAM